VTAPSTERKWAVVRIILGQAQIIGAVVSLVLLVTTGMSNGTAYTVAATCALLVTSLLLFGGDTTARHRGR
jgi:hypothetical protein